MNEDDITIDDVMQTMIAYCMNDYIRRVVADGLEKPADCGCCRQYNFARSALTVLQDLHLDIDRDVLRLALQNHWFHDPVPADHR